MKSIYEYDSNRINIQELIQAFLLEKEARQQAKPSIERCRQQLGYLCDYLASKGVQSVGAITLSTLRSFWIEFEKSHGAGSTDKVYQAIKACFDWYARKNKGWQNPIDDIAPPKASTGVRDANPSGSDCDLANVGRYRKLVDGELHEVSRNVGPEDNEL